MLKFNEILFKYFVIRRTTEEITLLFVTLVKTNTIFLRSKIQTKISYTCFGNFLLSF
jgi:hypothetical protein